MKPPDVSTRAEAFGLVVAENAYGPEKYLGVPEYADFDAMQTHAARAFDAATADLLKIATPHPLSAMEFVSDIETIAAYTPGIEIEEKQTNE